MTSEQIVVAGGPNDSRTIGPNCTGVWTQASGEMRSLMIDNGSAFQEEKDDRRSVYGADQRILTQHSPDGLDIALITHPHLDHIGYLPVAVRDRVLKPEAQIWGSPQDCRISILSFSDAENKEGAPYGLEDCLEADSRLRVIEQPGPFQPLPGLEIIAIPNGHAPGSKAYKIPFASGDSLLAMGDFCLHDQPIVKGALMPSQWSSEWLEEPVTHVLGEFTYVEDEAEPLPLSESFDTIVERAIKDCSDGKTVVIAVFSQVKFPNVKEGTLDRLKAAGISCYIDGQLAISIHEAYINYPWSDRDLKIRPLGGDSGITAVKGRREREEMLSDGKPKVIFATGGLGFMGSSAYYFENFLDKEKFAFYFTSFLPPGCFGDRVCKVVARKEGNRILKATNRDKQKLSIPIRATIRRFGVRSHATFGECLSYFDELLEVQGTQKFKCIIVAHTTYSGMLKAMPRLQRYADTIIPGVPGTRIRVG